MRNADKLIGLPLIAMVILYEQFFAALIYKLIGSIITFIVIIMFISKRL